MKTQSNRRNFIQKSLVIATGLASARLVNAEPSSLKNITDKVEPSNETLKTIHNLHTTHGNFSSKEIPDNEIELIKQACIRAANSSNMQTYSILEIRDKTLMKDVCGYIGSSLLLFCVDYNRLIASAGSLNLPYYPGDMASFVTGSINTSIAAQTAVIAARSLGIDALLTNGIHRGNIDRHWDLLKLPEKQCMPLIALVLGYADKQPDQIVGRLDGKEIFHQQTYQKPSAEDLEKITAKYDDPELHLGLNQDWKAQGHEHYLEWLFKKWLGRDTKPKEQDTQLFAQLKKRGFVETM
jgi:nitroreductase